MKSIRLSLLVYFLLLLAIALGAVSLLVYRNTEKTLLGRKEAIRTQLLDHKRNTLQMLDERLQASRKTLLDQHDHRCHLESEKLDDALLAEARALASVALVQFQYNRVRFTELLPLGLLTAGLAPSGHVLVPIWAAEVGRNALAYRIQRMLAAEIQFNEEVLHSDNRVTEYFQISSEWGNTWRSQSMEGRTFPFNPNWFTTPSLLDWRFDDAELEPGFSVRRVVLKAPVGRVRFPWMPPPPLDRGRSREPRPEPFVGPPAPPPPSRFTERSSPSIFVHCSALATDRDVAILRLWLECEENLNKLQAEVDSKASHVEQHLHQELDNLETESQATLASLRNQLLLISMATFAATTLGGFLLVRHGLAPLHRLSDAVSRVSARDFRLEFDEPHLRAELRPIVGRLNETLELLKRAFAREKQAAADISHELRTPLAALLTTIDVALRKQRSPAEYREMLEDCRASGQQMSQLVEHLLKLARLDAGVDQMRPRSVDVAQLAKQCATLVRPLAEARGLNLQVNCTEPASLTADPDKLREVLNNLLHNAIEYNRPRGSVRLSVGRENGHLAVEVRDTGIGIAEEVREHIFERFYRADPSRQADGLHAGLGLAIVKGYVEQMGGHIAVESELGEGSTFRVTLPVNGTNGGAG